MRSRRTSHAPSVSTTTTTNNNNNTHGSLRAPSLIRPSMHSEYMVRKESTASSSAGSAGATATSIHGRHVRVRSLSSDSDAGFKPRSSVPLLYASTISSMSTLSSSFYQYDSTGGATLDMDAVNLDAMDTPSSMASGSASKKHSAQQQQDPPLRLPPVQERAIRRDAARMTRELIAEQLQALDVLHNRRAFGGGGFPTQTLGNEVATAKGVRVFEKTGLGGGGASGRVKKHAGKRLTAHWQVHATMDEVLALLVRTDRNLATYTSCQAALHPETVNSKLLWRATGPLPSTASTYSHSHDGNDHNEDDDDDRGVITVGTDDDEHDVYGGTDGRTKLRVPRSINITGTRRRRRRPADWIGINWWVQHMPNKLSRDRDFIVLEKQSEFVTGGGIQSQRGRPRRGFVHWLHSVDLADVSSVEKRLVSPFVRGLVIQSGLVVVESDEPGVLDVANTLELDCAGHLSARQQRQLVVKRLLQVETLNELLWKTRLLQSQRLVAWRPQLEKSSDGDATKCGRCQSKASRFSRRQLEPCRACDRVVCSNCSAQWEFAHALVAAAATTSASQRGPLSMDVDQDGVLKARVCGHCVAEHAKPKVVSYSHSMTDTVPADSFNEDDERSDVVHRVLPTAYGASVPRQPQRTQQHHYASRSQLPRQSSAPQMRPSEWHPSRSSRVAESLVDDFLMSISPSASVLPKTVPLSPSALSEEPPTNLSDDDREEEERLAHQAATRHGDPSSVRPSGMEPLAWQQQPQQPQRRESRAPSMRRPSTSAAYTPLQGYDQPPRKRSMFETIPEPAPRKNVVLYEG